MNMIEKQTELGKSLYEINTSTVSEIAELSRKNIEQYIEVNKSFGEKLPELREINDFMSLQREYGETMVSNVRTAIETQNAILQNAFTESREAFQAAFTTETTVEAKPKAKVKKAA
jgi:hypothetical protein